MKNLWLTEWKTMTRQRSYLAFLFLWVVIFSLLFLLERNNEGISGFTNITGTIINILLYLLPLFMMIIGSFSITTEMENGQWNLLRTYPVSSSSYLLGKFLGIFTAQLAVFTLSYGLSMAVGLLSGVYLSVKWLLEIYFFSILLIYIFLMVGIFLGTFVRTRWKALIATVTIWFFMIMIWPTALITLLGMVPYPLIEPLMKIAMMLNPAEFLRIFFIIHWDSGSVFGQSYDSIVQLYQSRAGLPILISYLITYPLILFTFATLFLRGRQKQ